jgi:hypothetical protein
VPTVCRVGLVTQALITSSLRSGVVVTGDVGAHEPGVKEVLVDLFAGSDLGRPVGRREPAAQPQRGQRDLTDSEAPMTTRRRREGDRTSRNDRPE